LWGWAALFLRDRRQFFHYVSVISFVFYVCYLIYIALPVMGPRAFFREIDGFRLPDEIQAYAVSPSYPEAIKPGLFRHAVSGFTSILRVPAPRSRAATSPSRSARFWFSFRYLRRLRWAHPGHRPSCSARRRSYCRYHYVVDVAAGALTTALLLPLGNRLYRGLGQSAALARGFNLWPARRLNGCRSADSGAPGLRATTKASSCLRHDRPVRRADEPRRFQILTQFRERERASPLGGHQHVDREQRPAVGWVRPAPSRGRGWRCVRGNQGGQHAAEQGAILGP